MHFVLIIEILICTKILVVWNRFFKHFTRSNFSETKRIQAEKQEIRSEMREHRKENIALAKNYR